MHILNVQRHQLECQVAIEASIEEVREKLSSIEERVDDVREVVVVSGIPPNVRDVY